MQFASALDKFLEIIRIRDALKVAAINGFRFVMFGHCDGFQTVVACGHINVTPHEVHEVGALQ